MKNHLYQVLACFGLAATLNVAIAQDLQPVKRVNPDYPNRAVKNDLEGWVVMNFVLDSAGKVSDVIAIASSDPLFEAPAVAALSRWEYPAQPDGSGSHETSMRFQLNATSGASANFNERFKELEARINNKDTAGLEEELNNLVRKENWSRLEDSLTHWLRFRYYASVGNSARAYQSLDMAIAGGNGVMPADMMVSGIEAAFTLSTQIGKPGDALAWREFLQGLESVKSSSLYEPALQRIDAQLPALEKLIASDSQVVASAELLTSYWSHTLVHNDFAVTDINGSLNKIHVRCSNTSARQLEVVADATMELPDGWEDCKLFFSGDKGTTFTVVELPTVAAGANVDQ